MKKIGIIQQSSTFNSPHAKEGIDIALNYASFGCELFILFQGEGIYQLLDKTNPKLIGSLSHQKRLDLLDLYEVDHFYVIDEEMNHMQLSLSELKPQTTLISYTQARLLLAEQDHIFCS